MNPRDVQGVARMLGPGNRSERVEHKICERGQVTPEHETRRLQIEVIPQVICICKCVQTDEQDAGKLQQSFLLKCSQFHRTAGEQQQKQQAEGNAETKEMQRRRGDERRRDREIQPLFAS